MLPATSQAEVTDTVHDIVGRTQRISEIRLQLPALLQNVTDNFLHLYKSLMRQYI